jgi:hypothetical protein
MPEPRKQLNLRRIAYKDLNARQKENYNFQKVSAVLAEYGYHTIRLSEDWLGADFIAYHLDGEFLRVQLKSRLRLDAKYYGKEIWICFPHGDTWYLYPHDEALHFAIDRGSGVVGKREDWFTSDGQAIASAAYDWPTPPRLWLDWLSAYDLRPQSTAGLSDEE